MNDKIIILINHYKKWLGDSNDQHPKIQRDNATWVSNNFLQPDQLETLSDDDYINRFKQVMSFADGPISIKWGRASILTERPNFIRNIRHLLDSSDKISAINDTLSGKYKIHNAGQSFWSIIFSAYNPDEFPKLNSKTNDFFALIGIDIGKTIEDRYANVTKYFKNFTSLVDGFDFFDMDHLMHYGTEVAEGKKVILENFPIDMIGEIIDQYIRIVNENINQHIKEERYKFDDLKTFQENFDIDAPDIYQMLESSLPSDGLGDSSQYFPRKMILIYTQESPEEIRMAIKNLYDSSLTLDDRINKYDKIIKDLNDKRNLKLNLDSGSYSDARFKSLLLSLRFPNEFMYYKKTQLLAVYKLIYGDNKRIGGDDANKIKLSQDLGQKLLKNLQQRNEFTNIKQKLASDFDDDNLWLAQDVCYTVGDGISTINTDRHEIMKNKTPNLALNTIYYGPPGTGKTYESRKIAKEFLSCNKAINTPTEQATQNIEKLTWMQIVALTMYQNGADKSYKISELRDDKSINTYATTKKSRNHGATITTTILTRAKDGATMLAEKYRRPEEYFEKGTSPNTWKLTKQGIDYVESSLLTKFRDLKNTVYELKNTKSWEDYFTFITFHQSYSYEEFVEGIRPHVGASGSIIYEVRSGIFKRVCEQAINDPDNNYIIVIDEINRGNISKIFGELITLLEKNKRLGAKDEIAVTLPYSGDKLLVPENLYIIGTMNTADRSIALLDIALRRRFEFIELMPNYSLEAINEQINGVHLANLLKAINNKISVMIDRDHQIGHSYFLNIKTADDLHKTWYKEILPLLQEYFYNDWEKLAILIGNYRNNKGFVECHQVTFQSSEIEDTNLYNIHIYNPDDLCKALKALANEENTNPDSL